MFSPNPFQRELGQPLPSRGARPSPSNRCAHTAAAGPRMTSFPVTWWDAIVTYVLFTSRSLRYSPCPYMSFHFSGRPSDVVRWGLSVLAGALGAGLTRWMRELGGGLARESQWHWGQPRQAEWGFPQGRRMRVWLSAEGGCLRTCMGSKARGAQRQKVDTHPHPTVLNFFVFLTTAVAWRAPFRD